ncbi:MAG TPA: hypothetical protein VHM67_02330, partial [Gemmatimonadaceae bacterium]|nr:hypothetical protein [Gemmatimonadaceae bacterium]
MPSVAVVVLCYAAGALAALQAALRAGVVACALLGVLAAARRELRFAAASAALAAGLLAGTAAARADRACAMSVVRAGAARFDAAVPMRPGDFAVARLTGADGCTFDAAMSVRSGEIAAGSTGVVAGRLTLSQRGPAMVDAHIRSTAPPRGLARLRERLGRIIDDAFGTDAPVARALLIADMRAIPPATRDRFARAG